MKPKASLSISIVVPTFNAEKQLPATLLALLSQTRVPDEILVIDDGSTDNSVKVAESFGYPVRVISQKNAGAAAARYKGVSQAKGDFIIFNDAGDISLPRRIELLHDAIISNPGCVAAFGITWNQKDPSPERSYITNKPLDGCITRIDDIFNRYLGQSWPLAVGMNIGILREVALISCDISPFYRAANDYALQVSTSCYGSFACVDEVLMYYEQTPGGISSNNGYVRQRAYALCAATHCFEESKSQAFCNKSIFKKRVSEEWPDIAINLWLKNDKPLINKTFKIGIKYGEYTTILRSIWWALDRLATQISVDNNAPQGIFLKTLYKFRKNKASKSL